MMKMLLLFGLTLILMAGTVEGATTTTELADGENTTLHDGVPQLGTDYTETHVWDAGKETIDENSTGRLKWNFDFNTTQRESISELRFSFKGVVSRGELFNFTIYNYGTGDWDYLNHTTMFWPTSEILETVFSGDDRNLSQYVNQTDGQMKIGVEDINTSSTIGSRLYIDYLEINVTTVPERPYTLTFRYKSNNFTLGETNTLRFSMKNNDFVVDAGNRWTLRYLIRLLWRMLMT